MTEAQYLEGRLLLALPGMFDPNFDHAVIAMCVHNAEGALGIGIGHQRSGITFHDVLEELGIDPGQSANCPVHHGGPVEPGRGFVLHSPDWAGEEIVQVNASFALSASPEVLRAITGGRGPAGWLIALGYAGWGAGQLENEMRHHGWHAAASTPEILFETSPSARWSATWRAEGIDPALLSNVTGRA
jgi:putative transcriptional regulator